MAQIRSLMLYLSTALSFDFLYVESILQVTFSLKLRVVSATPGLDDRHGLQSRKKTTRTVHKVPGSARCIDHVFTTKKES